MVDARKMYKVVVLGEAGVGKSSLIRRYTQGYFSERTTTTVGVDRVPVNVTVGSEQLQFQVLDTSGCYGFRGLIQSYMNNIDAVIFMYDLTSKETFASLPLWNSLLRSSGAESITKILVGNKRDLDKSREVMFRNAKNYAEFEGMVAMEISVKEAESVDLVFQCVGRELNLKKLRAIELEEDQKEAKVPRHQRSMMDFIDADEESSPKMFVRRLSLLMMGKKKREARKESLPLLKARSKITIESRKHSSAWL